MKEYIIGIVLGLGIVNMLVGLIIYINLSAMITDIENNIDKFFGGE